MVITDPAGRCKGRECQGVGIKQRPVTTVVADHRTAGDGKREGKVFTAWFGGRRQFRPVPVDVPQRPGNRRSPARDREQTGVGQHCEMRTGKIQKRSVHTEQLIQPGALTPIAGHIAYHATWIPR